VPFGWFSEVAFWYSPGKCGTGTAATAANWKRGAEGRAENFYQRFFGL
jgi:hypothetical protein